MNSINNGQNHQLYGNQFQHQNINPGIHYDSIYAHPTSSYFHALSTQYASMPFQPVPMDAKPLQTSTPSSGTRSDTPESGEDASAPKKKACVPVPEEKKDDTYWRKRNKNNESARRSREQKKFKATKVTEEIVKCRHEIAQLEREIMRARQENNLVLNEYERLQLKCNYMT